MLDRAGNRKLDSVCFRAETQVAWAWEVGKVDGTGWILCPLLREERLRWEQTSRRDFVRFSERECLNSDLIVNVWNLRSNAS